MVKYILLVIICVLLGIFAICAFFMAQGEKKKRIKTESKLNEVNKHEEHAAEIISNANKTKADARTGDHSADFNFMANKLHDYAHK